MPPLPTTNPPLLPGFLAIIALALGGALSYQHPLSATVTCSTFLLVVAAAFRYPTVLPFAIPAALPIIGFAPFSGWIVVEELDLLVLAIAAGAYARQAVSPRRRLPPSSPTTRLLIALFGISLLVSLFRGVEDAGGWIFSNFQNYYDPLNSARLTKGFLLTLLVLPLFKRLLIEHSTQAEQRFTASVLAGLGGGAAAVIWERIRYTSLLDFSSDYRATGSFWEMHVGGATLDGYLTLCLPFAIWTTLMARSTILRLSSATVAALAGYACLATFSRGVYLAVPLSLVVLGLAFWRSRKQNMTDSAESFRPGHLAVLGIVFSLGATAAFSGAGYRGLMAWGMCSAILLPTGAYVRGHRIHLLAAGAGAFLVSACLISLSWLIPKGPYVLFGVSFTCAALLLWYVRCHEISRGPTLVTVGLLNCLILSVAVGVHWGDNNGLAGMALAAGILVTIFFWQWKAPRALWTNNPAALTNLGLGILTLSATIAVFGGGAYMSERFSTTSQDLQGRLRHWELGTDLLATPGDWTLGKGLGRFPASYLYSIPDGEFPGGYRLNDQDGERNVTLTGSRRPIGFGEILRLSQRIDYSSSPTYNFSADVRSSRPATLHVELCEKHLLYSHRCATRQIAVPAKDDAWTPVTTTLSTGPLNTGAWFAERQVVFSVGIESVSGEATIDNLQLVGGNGTNLLVNHDFSEQLAHWFFTSDRVHMPWHIKSLFANVLFDQGIIGLILFFLLTGRALWRLSAGRGRHHALAPPLLAGLSGFLVVGLFDSLIDAARLNFLFWLMVLLALFLPATPGAANSSATGHR